ncbi:protein of unknown function [Taphrina deformans PYCC 5710]|uniref:SVP1-like protein 2 n=1 Tax=Taphrina deformans (strain PYCC 5710 / ATCC 11124 / CBS 356.35 / IMI 108563 / JCM 9778 / NBRC 8474) TaxID=1097556 RepID=R4XEX6_TAPDE|nr:protein of unknown function [Taphrina deformans PYCC 5710]|eukprot:CCG84336.1 protein of unknown function [Taphrina deformans PYCC 5710]
MVSRVIPGGLVLAELLGRSNILAIVTRQEPYRIQLWDDVAEACVTRVEPEISAITAIRINQDILLCALKDRVRLYNISDDLDLVAEYRTGDNDSGLVELSTGPQYITIFPGQRQGHLQILQLGPKSDNATRLADSRRNVIIAAHAAQLICIAMSSDGLLVATASKTGTLIRVWSAIDGQQLIELRRGIDKVNIQSMSFSTVTDSGQSKLAVVSDKATIHIFSVSKHDKAVQSMNGKSAFAVLASAGFTYLGSTWSTIQARIHDTNFPQAEQIVRGSRRFVLGWSSGLVFVVLSHEGGLWKFVIASTPNQPESYTCYQESYRSWKESLGISEHEI